MFLINKIRLEEIIPMFFDSDEWMILKKKLQIFFVLSETFYYFLFLIDTSDLKNVILIFLVFSDSF